MAADVVTEECRAVAEHMETVYVSPRSTIAIIVQSMCAQKKICFGVECVIIRFVETVRHLSLRNAKCCIPMAVGDVMSTCSLLHAEASGAR